MPESSKPRVPHHNIELITVAVAAPVAVVVSTSSTILGVAAPSCVCEEDVSTANSVMVREAPTPTAPAAESGSGARSPPPWAASATGSWGPPPLVAPPSLEPRDTGIMFGFGALQHTSKGQETWMKSKKGKTTINAWHTTESRKNTCGGEGLEPPDPVVAADLLPIAFKSGILSGAPLVSDQTTSGPPPSEPSGHARAAALVATLADVA
jgi:hypothetical protein